MGARPSNTGNNGAHRASGSALSRRPVSQDAFFREACASTHRRPRLSTPFSPRRCCVTLWEEAGRPVLTREHLRGGGADNLPRFNDLTRRRIGLNQQHVC